MRTTLAIDDDLLAKAQALTGVSEKNDFGPRGPAGANTARKCETIGALGRF